MKTLRLFGLALAAILLVANFTSCRNDEEPAAIEQLEGTWLSTRIQSDSTNKENGEKDLDDISFDVSSPKDDMVKVKCTKNGENIYKAEFSYYGNGKWNIDYTDTFKYENGKLINQTDKGDDYEVKTLNATTMVLYQSWDDELEKGYIQITFQKEK